MIKSIFFGAVCYVVLLRLSEKQVIFAFQKQHLTVIKMSVILCISVERRKTKPLGLSAEGDLVLIFRFNALEKII